MSFYRQSTIVSNLLHLTLMLLNYGNNVGFDPCMFSDSTKISLSIFELIFCWGNYFHFHRDHSLSCMPSNTFEFYTGKACFFYDL